MFLIWFVVGMEPSSTPHPSKTSFKQIVVQDHLYQPNPKYISSSTPCAPMTHHHKTDASIETYVSLNNDDILVIDEKDRANRIIF